MGKKLGIGGALLALSLPALAQAGEVEIAIKGMQFVPSRVELKVGDTVRWRNEDIVPHTVTAVGKKPSFDSDSIPAGGEFRFTAKKTGSYPYTCRFHPMMKGKIVVKR
jgi:plastocyanin